MLEMLTWIDWSIIVGFILSLGGLVYYFRKHTVDMFIKEIEEIVTWVEGNMVHAPGAEKLEEALILVLERYKHKSIIFRWLIKGLKADAGAKIIDYIQEVIEKYNNFAKKKG